MGHLKSLVVGAVLGGIVCGVTTAQAQSLGSFTWQLQPFCNRLTVTVTQNGSIYTLDGYDDQCGAPQRAPLVGMATPNPDGSIGLGFHIATSPGGKTVSVEARISLATVGGPWTDSAGNSGTLVLNGAAAGSARPAPPAGVTWGMSVTSPTNGGTGLRLKSALTGTIVQPAPALIVEGFNPSTEDHFGYAGVLSTTSGGDAMAAYSDSGNGLVAVAGGTGPVGSAAVFARAGGGAFAVRAESYSVRPAIYAQNFAGPAIEVQGGNVPAIVASGGAEQHAERDRADGEQRLRRVRTHHTMPDFTITARRLANSVSTNWSNAGPESTAGVHWFFSSDSAHDLLFVAAITRSVSALRCAASIPPAP